MAVTITFRQTRDSTAEGKFRVFTEILGTTGFRADHLHSSTWAMLVFERDAGGDEYQHVAKVGDIENWEERDETGHESDAYYRYHSVTLEYDTLAEAQSEADVQKTRFQQLVDDYDAYVTTYTAGSPEEDTYTS